MSIRSSPTFTMSLKMMPDAGISPIVLSARSASSAGAASVTPPAATCGAAGTAAGAAAGAAPNAALPRAPRHHAPPAAS
eukprot:471381-Prymnesium_polylepis.1